MKRWEYMFYDCAAYKASHAILNEYGKEGWELVAAVRNLDKDREGEEEPYDRHVFKREIEIK